MPHSKFLVHWTGKRDLESLPHDEKIEGYAVRLKDWYQNGLFTRRTVDPELAIRLPKSGAVNKLKNEQFVRLCFTEVRLSQAEKHSDSYGRLGIGFANEVIANKGGRPVIYVPWEARNRLLERNIFRVWEKSKSSRNAELQQLLSGIVAFCKPMSEGTLGSADYKDNYEEMEWRIVEDGSRTFTPDHVIPDGFRMRFDPHDVALIVFPDQEVMRRTLDDADMKALFSVHEPNLLLLNDCSHF